MEKVGCSIYNLLMFVQDIKSSENQEEKMITKKKRCSEKSC